MTRRRKSSRRWDSSVLSALAIITLVTGGSAEITQPADMRLDAFRQHCLPTRLDPALTLSGFEGAGWTVVTEAAHPELPALLELDRAQALAAEATGETVILRKGALFATVNQLTAEITEDEAARYATCAVWDLDADAAIPDDQISTWTGVSPRVRLDAPGVGRIVQWDLSGLPGAGNLQASCFPEGSPAIARTGFTGAAIFLTSDLDATP